MSNSQLSGREQARAHRQAQKQGKTATAAATSRPARTTTTAAKAPARRPVTPNAAAPASAAGRDAAKQRRAQQKSGKVSQTQGTPNLHPKAKAKLTEREPVVQPREKAERKTSSSRPANARKVNVKNGGPVAQSSGRNMAKAWRKAGAKGKAGQSAMKKSGTSSGSIAKMSNPDASTREIAKKVRKERCTKGKSGCKPAETASSKRARAAKERNAAPSKVGESSTASGQSVSGTQVGQGRKVMTGAETGACKVVSGTEYLAQEEFVSHCNSEPTAGPAKVSQSQTTRGQVVSGNEVGRSEAVTGDESGTCSAVTGTEYIPADQSSVFCGADAPAKSVMKDFSVMSEPSNSGRSGNVTGGGGYKSQSTTLRPNEAPQKVVMSSTVMGNATTGTQVGRLEDVTGTEYGQCKSVTGTGYQSPEESQALCGTEPAPTAKKVTTSGTSRGQIVTGDRSGGNFDLTGAEAGTCQAVTGSAYAGVENAATCSPEQSQAIQQRVPAGVNHAVSGVQPGPVGLTGAQKGACSLVSGSHYQGNDQTSMVCDSANAAQPGQSDYPMMMNQQPAIATPVAPVAPSAPEAQASAITGDAWDRGNKVTGTEGPWASSRNASIRGAAGQSPMGASQYRPVAMEEVPQSPITGSSGNTDTGAKVTLSGGARA